MGWYSNLSKNFSDSNKISYDGFHFNLHRNISSDSGTWWLYYLYYICLHIIRMSVLVSSFSFCFFIYFSCHPPSVEVECPVKLLLCEVSYMSVHRSWLNSVKTLNEEFFFIYNHIFGISEYNIFWQSLTISALKCMDKYIHNTTTVCIVWYKITSQCES